MPSYETAGVLRTDGCYILFRAVGSIRWIRADGMGQAQSLTQSNNQQFPNAFTREWEAAGFLGSYFRNRGVRRLDRVCGERQFRPASRQAKSVPPNSV